MDNKQKTWKTLNSHGKYCLMRFVFSISASDMTTSQLDYIFYKDLVDYGTEYEDAKFRVLFAGHCLTDLGIETVRHYFPDYQFKP